MLGLHAYLRLHSNAGEHVSVCEGKLNMNMANLSNKTFS